MEVVVSVSGKAWVWFDALGVEGVVWINVAVGEGAGVLKWGFSGGKGVQEVKGVNLCVSKPALSVSRGVNRNVAP